MGVVEVVEPVEIVDGVVVVEAVAVAVVVEVCKTEPLPLVEVEVG